MTQRSENWREFFKKVLTIFKVKIMKTTTLKKRFRKVMVITNSKLYELCWCWYCFFFFHESLIIWEGIVHTLQFERVFHFTSTTTLKSVYFSVRARGYSNPSSFWQYRSSQFLDIGWDTPSRNRNITIRISGRFGGASEGRRSWGGLGRASPTSSHWSAPYLEICSAVQIPVEPS